MTNDAPAFGLILLAAGGSTRLGRPKQLLPFRGQTLLRHAAEAAAASGCRPVIVVLGAQAECMVPELAGLPVQFVTNPMWEQGMGASIRAGLSALTESQPEAAGVVVAVCDQPALSSTVFDALVTEARRSEAPLVASEYDGTLGVPALFRRALFPELAALNPAAGAKPVIQRHAACAARVPFPDGALDIDRPADLARLT